MTRRDAIERLASALVMPAAFQAVTSAAGQGGAAGPAARRMVPTVTGALDPAKLGFTLSHEHVCAASAGMWQTWPDMFGGRARFVRTAVEQLRQARDEGVNSLIDVTTVDLGRDIRLLEEVSRKSGMQIVACTGHWLDPSRSMNARTVEELTELFVREIQRGIEGTDIKAGVIKVATGGTVDPFGDKVLRAAARASKATGVPITTHSPGNDRAGEKQAAVLESEGLRPSKVCIGHTDNSPAEYQMGLVKRGYYLGMDQLPRGGAPPAGSPPSNALLWEQRYAQIKSLVDAGFANRIMLGNDHSIAMSLQPTAADKARLAQNPDGVLFVTRKAVPALKAIGVSDQAIRTMTVEAPRRFLEG